MRSLWEAYFSMNVVLVVAGLMGLGLLAYLFYVLFRGESYE